MSKDVQRPAISTLGELAASGWRSRPVKVELATNAASRLASGAPLFEGFFGYDDTVLPQLANALLAGHDVILLGERGQAKSRLVRTLVNLLDEWTPVVAGSEINDDPNRPISRYARELVAEAGPACPITWLHRSERFGEKLATPDTSVADLIGEIDPIKVAEGRYLSDELTLHYGLIPRTNRGIFGLNELPDLAERIQVALFNILEERDVQIRGFRVRLPLDLLLVASANPEDYTNRGRIVTPLKDRFGAQIRTHYPADIPTEIAIVVAEARPLVAVTLPASGRNGGPGESAPAAPGAAGPGGAGNADESAQEHALGGIQGSALAGTAGQAACEAPRLVPSVPRVGVPAYMLELIAAISQLARQSPHVSRRSGVSVRLSITNFETLVANAARRAIALGEAEAVPRISDLAALVASTMGKLEIETFDEDGDEEIAAKLVRQAVLAVFKEHCPPDSLGAVLAAFDEGAVVHTGDDLPAHAYASALETVPALGGPVSHLAASESPAAIASALELVLEGLHLSKRLNKDAAAGRAAYRSRLADRPGGGGPASGRRPENPRGAGGAGSPGGAGGAGSPGGARGPGGVGSPGGARGPGGVGSPGGARGPGGVGSPGGARGPGG